MRRAKPVDPVAIAALAIDRFTSASFRACWHGKPVTVAVPDEATAAVFRAALAETAQRRPTDRLITILVH